MESTGKTLVNLSGDLCKKAKAIKIRPSNFIFQPSKISAIERELIAIEREFNKEMPRLNHDIHQKVLRDIFVIKSELSDLVFKMECGFLISGLILLSAFAAYIFF